MKTLLVYPRLDGEIDEKGQGKRTEMNTSTTRRFVDISLEKVDEW